MVVVAKHHDTEAETQTFDLRNYVVEQDNFDGAFIMNSLVETYLSQKERFTCLKKGCRDLGSVTSKKYFTGFWLEMDVKQRILGQKPSKTNFCICQNTLKTKVA